MMQITYQKRDGSIIKRQRKTEPSFRIGQETSMGWKVLNVEYELNNKYYSSTDYYSMLHQNKQRFIRKQKNKELYMNNFRTLMYYCAAVVIVNLLKYILETLVYMVG